MSAPNFEKKGLCRAHQVWLQPAIRGQPIHSLTLTVQQGLCEVSTVTHKPTIAHPRWIAIATIDRSMAQTSSLSTQIQRFAIRKHRNRTKRANFRALAAACAADCVCEARRLDPVFDFKTQDVGTACAHTSPTAGALCGVDVGKRTGWIHSAMRFGVRDTSRLVSGGHRLSASADAKALQEFGR